MNPPFPNCYHGGAFFTAIGAEFDHLERRHRIINADVLDAWFDPSPPVVAALKRELPWLLRTSPPTQAEGMIRVIAATRGVPATHILPGAGSSDLIFLALREWLTRESRVLILDPMYGEYAHVLETVVACRVDRLPLSRAENYRVNLDQLSAAARREYDLIILVNPNSPTGQHIPRAQLEPVLRDVPPATRIWVDETYNDYAGPAESLEPLAVAGANLVVCKSLSKAYALSGIRTAYLCGPESLLAALRRISPPWAVSLPAQVATVAALPERDYYLSQWRETRRLREELAANLTGFAGWQVIPGIANFVLCHLPPTGPTAADLVRRCRAHGLFLRDVGSMGQRLGSRALRIAVKDHETNLRMMQILQTVLRAGGAKTSSLAPLSTSSRQPPSV